MPSDALNHLLIIYCHPYLSYQPFIYPNDKSKTWQANLQLITKFDTVEDFWALYNHIQVASKLSSGCDYSLFKDGIEPMWEDRRNKCGGRWLITLSKQQRHTELDKFWLETVRYIKRVQVHNFIMIYPIF
uniref:Eukaryotic translation initiation factor 4E family member 1B n=1 Tax=Erpetoichthys calabaricus TaxID=27687 RepID=A0A8C4TD91_ERPCA